MLAQTNSTPDEHICSLAAYMHVHMHAYAPVLAHHYYLMHTLQYVEYDHSICNHTIIHHTARLSQQRHDCLAVGALTALADRTSCAMQPLAAASWVPTFRFSTVWLLPFTLL